MTLKHFEDFEVGRKTVVGEYLLTKEEMMEFAEKWDPQPFHVDEEAAKESAFQGLIACSCHMISIAIRLVNNAATKANVIAGLGWDEVRFPKPARPGDRLSLTLECLEVRESKTRPDRGIVTNRFTVTNQRGEPVITFKDAILVAKRDSLC